MSKFSLFIFLSLFSYSFQAFSKTVVISDIDDTLKKANSMGKAPEQIYHFLRKIPYFEMRDLLNEIKTNEQSKHGDITYYYVSAAKQITFDAQEWLVKYHFPLGRSVLKKLKDKESTYDFKHAVIKEILKTELNSTEPVHVIMFGDNAQADAAVYTDLTKELSLDSKIYIRDVRAEATVFEANMPVKKLIGANYYFSEVELLAYPEYSFVSADLKLKTYESYKNKTLIPAYTLITLERKLQDQYQDKARAQSDAKKFWNEYYSKF
jgi:hypothetical protein